MNTEEIEPTLNAIYTYFNTALEYLAHIQAQTNRIAQDGMYDALPSEIWRHKEGQNSYLYMYFPLNHRTGEHHSPHGKRKLYVGCKPDKIKEARRLTENRRQWEALNLSARTVTQWLQRRHHELGQLLRRTQHAPAPLDMQQVTIPNRTWGAADTPDTIHIIGEVDSETERITYTDLLDTDYPLWPLTDSHPRALGPEKAGAPES